MPISRNRPKAVYRAPPPLLPSLTNSPRSFGGSPSSQSNVFPHLNHAVEPHAPLEGNVYGMSPRNKEDSLAEKYLGGLADLDYEQRLHPAKLLLHGLVQQAPPHARPRPLMGR